MFGLLKGLFFTQNGITGIIVGGIVGYLFAPLITSALKKLFKKNG